MSVNSLGVQIQTNKMSNNVAVKPADLPYNRALYNSTSDAFVSSDDNAVNAGNNSKSKKGWNFGLRALMITSMTAAYSVLWNIIMNGGLPSRKELGKLIPIGLAISIPLGLVGAFLLEPRERGKKETNKQ